MGSQLQEGERGRRTVVQRFREFDGAGAWFGWRSMGCRHRKQHGTQIRDRIRQNKRICRKVLPHRMRLISLDVGIIEKSAVKSAGGNADGNRENGEQRHYMAA